MPFQLFVPTFSLHSITTLATRQVGKFGPSIFLVVVSGSAELTVEALSNHLSSWNGTSVVTGCEHSSAPEAEREAWRSLGNTGMP